MQSFRSVDYKGTMPFGMVPVAFTPRLTGGGGGTLAHFFWTLFFLFVFIRLYIKKYFFKNYIKKKCESVPMRRYRYIYIAFRWHTFISSMCRALLWRVKRAVLAGFFASTRWNAYILRRVLFRLYFYLFPKILLSKLEISSFLEHFLKIDGDQVCQESCALAQIVV